MQTPLTGNVFVEVVDQPDEETSVERMNAEEHVGGLVPIADERLDAQIQGITGFQLPAGGFHC